MGKWFSALLMLVGVLFFSTSDILAQAPKYSNEFLAIGVGARGLGMGGAQVASVNDVTAGYWNPVGLLGIKDKFQIGAMHSEYFAGIAKYDYAAFAKPIDSTSAFGISFIRFGVDDIPNTTDLIDANGNIDYDRITSFSAADYALIISYAKRLKVPGLSIGGNVKIIHRNVGSFAKAWGFGLDFAAKYNVKGWQLTAVARDVTSTFNAWSFTLDERTIEVFEATGNEIPQNGLELTLPRIIFGGAKRFELAKGKVSLTPEINLITTFDGQRNVVLSGNPVSVEPVGGLEAGYADIVYLRMGVGNIQKYKNELNTDEWTFQPNMGIGVKIKRFSIDYALTDIGNTSQALYSHVFSLRLDM
jgi:hypothetical protein